jgi:hypothetical protein
MSANQSSGSRRSFAALGLLVAMLATPVHADVESDYGRGWTAFRQGNWKVVVEAMTAAIAQRPEERGRINIGSNNNQPYLPHYYLGLARFRLGDCRGALESWQRSLQQGYLRQFRQEDEAFSRYFPICEKQVEVETDLAAAQTSLTSLEILAKDPHLGRVWASEPGLGPSAARASQQLPKVRADFETALREREQQRITALTAVRTVSTSLRQQLDRVEQEAKTRRQALVAEARPRPEPSRPAATELAAPTVVAAAPTAVPVSAGVSLAAPPPDLPPDQLRTGIQRFVNARYREAIETLSSVSVGVRWRAQAALFRSAASYALFRATRDTQWRTRAVDAARECAKLAPDLQADERLLSPAFRRFFSEAVRGSNTVAQQTR